MLACYSHQVKEAIVHEPFLPLPLPSPPEAGLGDLLARAARRWIERRYRGRESRLAGSARAPRCRDLRLRFPFHPPGF